MCGCKRLENTLLKIVLIEVRDWSKTMNDIIRAVDHGEMTALVLLDLSAAFGTLDPQMLLIGLHWRDYRCSGLKFNRRTVHNFSSGQCSVKIYRP